MSILHDSSQTNMPTVHMGQIYWSRSKKPWQPHYREQRKSPDRTPPTAALSCLCPFSTRFP
eukprot:1137079-Pelagomonas_calceolata.AAC.2